MQLLILLGVIGLKFILVTCSDGTEPTPTNSSNLKYIPIPGLLSPCQPGLCSNGSKSAFFADTGRVTIDSLLPCQFNPVVKSKYLGNISLDAGLYCTPRTLRLIPGLTCCSPEKPRKNFPALSLFPVNSSAFTKKYIKLDWRKKSHRSKLPKTDEIIFLIHGYQEEPIKKGSIWITPAIEAWTKVRQKPVVVVDWSKGKQQFYQAESNVRTVGMALGYALVNWNITDRTILVGHSFGGQVVGEAGQYTKKRNKPIKECVALDPAYIGFDSDNPDVHISPDDCTLVQVIHSFSFASPLSLGPSMELGGSFDSSGGCDFWVNCGRVQGLNCVNPSLGALLDDVPDSKFHDSIPIPAACPHYRSTLVYVASVAKKCVFVGHECSDCDNMLLSTGCHVLLNGSTMSLPPYNDCQPSDRKDFYVKTAASNDYPYCPCSSL